MAAHELGGGGRRGGGGGVDALELLRALYRLAQVERLGLLVAVGERALLQRRHHHVRRDHRVQRRVAAAVRVAHGSRLLLLAVGCRRRRYSFVARNVKHATIKQRTVLPAQGVLRLQESFEHEAFHAKLADAYCRAIE